MNKTREIKPKTKVVVKNLPQQLAEEQFRATVEKFLGDDTDYFLWEKSFKKLETRCFVNFKTSEAARNFIQKFNGHIFITPKGKEQRAIVEYTTFQKTPKKSKRPDPRENTIEADAEYQKFLEELKKPAAQLPSAEEQLDKRLAETQGEQIIVTPLMEFIRNKRAMKAQKSKQQRAQGRKKKEEASKPATTPNKQADENVEKKRRDRSSRRKERDEKKKEKKKEKEVKQQQTEKQPHEKPAPSKPQEKQNEPKQEKAEKQPSKKETAEDKKNRNGIWQVRQHIEPGTVAIQQREKSPIPLNKDATAFQPGSMAHLQPFHTPQPLSYQAQPFVPQFQTMVPPYYQTVVPPYQVPHQPVQPIPQSVPQPQQAQQAKQTSQQQPSSPGISQRKQQRGGQKSGKTDKRPSAKVYTPKQATQGGNPQQTTGGP